MSHEVAHRADRVLDRNSQVDPVNVVEIDEFRLEAHQALLTARPDVFRTAIRARDAGGDTEVAELGRDHQELYLFGTVQEVPENFSGGLLQVTQLSAGFADDAFRNALRVSLGSEPHVETENGQPIKVRSDAVPKGLSHL